jgi:hypothetical protein
VDENVTAPLKLDFDYSFIVSYGEFLDQEYDIQAKTSLLIDLSSDIDVIISKFNPTTRNEVRRFDKMPEMSFHSSVEKTEELYSFYSTCERARNWFPIPISEFKSSLVFFICHNENPISGMSAYSHGEYIRIGRIFSLRRSTPIKQANLVFGVAGKRLVYEFCKYAKNEGFTYLDLGGVDLISETKSGISQFKLSFGGDLVPVQIGRFQKPAFSDKKMEFQSIGIDIT